MVVPLFEQFFKLVIYLNSIELKIPCQKTVACLWTNQTSFRLIQGTLVHFLGWSEKVSSCSFIYLFILYCNYVRLLFTSRIQFNLKTEKLAMGNGENSN